ncbi:MAG: family 1 encapsulin nanocompartment shell protein [Acidimicrobiia bacterium]
MSLNRDLAPLSAEAWKVVDDEADRTLRHFLAGRALVDFSGPHGWSHSAMSLGQVESIDGPREGVEAAVRVVQPLVELRTPFSLPRTFLDDMDRGRKDPDLTPVTQAAERAALAEDHIVFHGFKEAGMVGIAESSPHRRLPISDDYSRYPETVGQAAALLRGAGVAGPYGIALGARCYTGVVETTEHGGYPVFEHIRHILGGPITWAPAVDGAVVLSQRGGDFSLYCGGDFALGYTSHGTDSVNLYITESMGFRVQSPEAAVALVYSG